MGHTHHAPSTWTLPAAHARSAWSYTHAHVCTHVACVHTTHSVDARCSSSTGGDAHMGTHTNDVHTCTLCVPSGAHIHMTACTSLILNVHPHTHTHHTHTNTRTDCCTVTRWHTAIYLERATRCTILLLSCMCG